MRPLSILPAALVLVFMGATAFGADDTSASPTQALSSTKERGVVSIVPDSTLSQGRLVLKVVAFNRTREPAAFGDADVKILTAAGKPVGVVPLDQLIDEVRKAGGPRERRAASAGHNPADYSHPTIGTTGGAGQPELSGYTGAGNPTSGAVSAHTDIGTRGETADAAASPEVQQQIASLRAGILQQMIITSASAAGGQVVSEKLKFSRKESRTLRVLIDFNGEQHEFAVTAPSD